MNKFGIFGSGHNYPTIFARDVEQDTSTGRMTFRNWGGEVVANFMPTPGTLVLREDAVAVEPVVVKAVPVVVDDTDLEF